MDIRHLEGKRIFWSNKWDKLWLLVIPLCFLVDLFLTNRYSSFWFWVLLIFSSTVIVYVLYHMLHPKFVWVDPSTKDGREIQQKAIELAMEDFGKFEYTSEGFTLIVGGEATFTAWKDIEAIFAYMRDLYSVDELNLDVITKNNYRLHLTEEMPGWHQFIVKLKEAFPIIRKDFEINLMFPAFATNMTLVYDSKGRTLQEVMREYYKA